MTDSTPSEAPLIAELVDESAVAEAAAPQPLGGNRWRLPVVVRLVVFGGGFFAINVAVSVFVGVALFIYLALQPGADFRPLQAPDSALMLRLTALAAAPTVIMALALVWVCRRYLDQRDMASIGFFWPPRGMIWTLAAGGLAGVAPIAVAVGAIWWAGGYRYAGGNWSWFLLALTPTLVLMAFYEEIVFRSYIFQNIVEAGRPLTALLVSSVVFWLMHSFNPAAWTSPLVGANLFGAGVVLALAYRVSGDIWFPSAMHFGWNFAQGVLFSVPISGLKLDGFLLMRETGELPTWLTGGDFGLEASLLTFLLQLTISGALATILMRRSKKGVRTLFRG